MQQMLKRRLKAAGLPEILSRHSFRVLVVTGLLSQNVSHEDVQYPGRARSSPHYPDLRPAAARLTQPGRADLRLKALLDYGMARGALIVAPSTPAILPVTECVER